MDCNMKKLFSSTLSVIGLILLGIAFVVMTVVGMGSMSYVGLGIVIAVLAIGMIVFGQYQ